MSGKEEEIQRRTAAALDAIKRTSSADDSAAAMFATHHIEELDAAYWTERLGTPRPSVMQVIELLSLRSHWGDEGEDGMDTFDFTLPGDVTNYVVSVRFDEGGRIEDVSMES